MKQLARTLILTILVVWSQPSSAQFFKKLKQAVNHTVTNISSEMDENNPGGSHISGSGGLYIVKGTHAELSDFNPASLYTLQPGEKFDFTESCLLLHADLTAPQIIIIKGDKRYKIESGRQVPVTENNTRGCILNGNDINDHRLKLLQVILNQSQGNTPMQSANSMNQYIRMSINDKKGPGTYIDFDHKSYGPFGMVTSMVTNKAGDQFKAIVMIQPKGNDDTTSAMHFKIIGSTGENHALPFTYLCYFLNNHYDHPRVQGTLMNDLNHPVIYDPETQSEIRIIHDEDKIAVDQYNSALIWANKEHVYIDEKPVKAFPNDIRVIPAHVYVGKDHGHWAVWTTNGLCFYNNLLIDGVLSCKAQVQNGQEVLSWIVLGKDNKTLYLCHKVL